MAFAYLKKDKVSAEIMEAYEAPSLSFLMQQHELIEKLCEDAIDRQEQLARSCYHHVACGRDQAANLAEITQRDPRSRVRMSVAELPFSDIKYLNNIARNVVPDGLPSANRRFLVNACTQEFEDIELLEEQIKLLRYRMSAIEQEILDHTPRSSAEAVDKLQFISSLMMNGGSMEIDFFAYLVEECAVVIKGEKG